MGASNRLRLGMRNLYLVKIIKELEEESLEESLKDANREILLIEKHFKLNRFLSSAQGSTEGIGGH